jgi:mRNA interferase RelE/StbE
VASYKVLIKPSAVKELELIPKKDRQRIAAKIQALSDNPYPPGCHKLSGQERYRLRQGNYRIVYEIQGKELIVYVVKIGDRKEIYKD